LGLISLNPEEDGHDERIAAIKGAGIGLTDLAKKIGYGQDLDSEDHDIQVLLDAIEQHKPKIVCCNGKKDTKTIYNELFYGTYSHIAETLSHKPIFFIVPLSGGAALKNGICINGKK